MSKKCLACDSDNNNANFCAECGEKLNKVDETVEVEILGYEREASRLELFIRMFYSIPVCILLPLYGIIASICLFCQWFVILILGRRSKSLNGSIEGFIKYCVQLIGYFSYLTDERPGIVPKRVKFFRVIEEE